MPVEESLRTFILSSQVMILPIMTLPGVVICSVSVQGQYVNAILYRCHSRQAAPSPYRLYAERQGAAEVINIAKEHKVNEQIRVRQVRLIGAEGEQVGIIDTREAMQMARDAHLDLVMVSPQAVPPVCKLLDYGRFRYEQQQNEKENRKRARTQEVKSIKFRVKIDDNDFKTKTNHVKRFLQEGHKVKVTIMFRGRERTHPELGERILHRVADTLSDIGQPESPPNMMGMDMNMIMIPKVVTKRATADDVHGDDLPGDDMHSDEAQADTQAGAQTNQVETSSEPQPTEQPDQAGSEQSKKAEQPGTAHA